MQKGLIGVQMMMLKTKVDEFGPFGDDRHPPRRRRLAGIVAAGGPARIHHGSEGCELKAGGAPGTNRGAASLPLTSERWGVGMPIRKIIPECSKGTETPLTLNPPPFAGEKKESIAALDSIAE